ncbi:MAG: hypothetical protein WBE20_09365 [Candidatus Acidiferrales bacterium]
MADNRVSWKALALVVLVFVLGIALGGVGAHMWDARVIASQHRSRLKELKDELQLSPDQIKQFDALVSGARTKFNALDAQERAEWDPKDDQERQQWREQTRAILNPEQQAKFDAWTKHLDEERKKQQSH